MATFGYIGILITLMAAVFLMWTLFYFLFKGEGEDKERKYRFYALIITEILTVFMLSYFVFSMVCEKETSKNKALGTVEIQESR